MRCGSFRSTRASGLISTGWPVTNSGPVSPSSTVASKSSSISLPAPQCGCHWMPRASARSRRSGRRASRGAPPRRAPHWSGRVMRALRPRPARSTFSSPIADDRGAERVARAPCVTSVSVMAITSRVVGEGLVQLEHRELGVVAGGQALVAEHPPDLEHPLQPADDQPLEVQLEGDAQVAGRGRACCGASRRAGRGPRRPRGGGSASPPRRSRARRACERNDATRAWRTSNTWRASSLTMRSV